MILDESSNHFLKYDGFLLHMGPRLIEMTFFVTVHCISLLYLRGADGDVAILKTRLLRFARNEAVS